MADLYPLIRPEDVTESREAVMDLLGGGVPWLQIRGGTPRAVLAAVSAIAGPARESGTSIIVNDRADLAHVLGVGVHVGQDDLPPSACRGLLGPGVDIGLSTHTLEEAQKGLEDPGITYLAYGPIRPTGSKHDARPPVGLDALRVVIGMARRMRPGLRVVAIGGIDEEQAREILAAGSVVAVIGALRDPRGRLDRGRVASLLAATAKAA